MKAITINVSRETTNTVVIVAVDDWLALPLENVVARGVEDAGWEVLVPDMLNEVLEFQFRPLGENRRKMRGLVFAWFLQQVFAGGIIFKRSPMLAAQKTPKKPVHDPDPARGMGPACVDTFFAFIVHLDASCTYLFHTQIEENGRISSITEHEICQIAYMIAQVRDNTTLNDL